ncbi:MAG: rRNA pseudouridine synthase [Oscillospiraceae bacterium]|nr:rRNA pseudouridine synthase [Oscillospiraceae bacterium]
MGERLQKLISAAGLASRRKAEALILAGRVTVNGQTASLGQSADPATDRICVDGRPLPTPGEHTYLMLNKPRGYVSTLRDERGRRTVAELVADAGVRLYPVGRLDLNSDGLLLMTDDGALAQRLMHPAHAVDKVYRVEVSGDVEAALPLLRGPMELDGHALAPAQVEQLGAMTLRITIHEGRNRQVRRMCAAAGLRVLRLTRIAEGGLTLGDLPPGRWRHLRPEELRALGASDPEPQIAAKTP